MNADEHRALRELLGAFVLGRLSSAEIIAVQAHLDGCPDCRAELAEIAPLAAALRDVDPDRVISAAEPPAELGDRILGSVREGNRARRRRTLLQRAGSGLVAAAVLVGVFFIGLSRAPVPSTPPVVPLTVVVNVAGVSADAGLVKHTWGTELKLQASGLTAGGAYTVTFLRADGTSVSGGTFLGTGENPLNCSLNAALPLDETTEVLVNDAAGAVVLDAAIT